MPRNGPTAMSASRYKGQSSVLRRAGSGQNESMTLLRLLESFPILMTGWNRNQISLNANFTSTLNERLFLADGDVAPSV
jgi:hypothetical protein